MKIILLAGAALLGLLFRKGRPKTAWTNAGLPAPVAALPELETLATGLIAAIRNRSAMAAGLTREFQRRAGLVAVRDDSGIATASGVWDSQTRQAAGYYGRIFQEDTPS